MFYELRDRLTETDGRSVDPNVLTVGCVTAAELPEYGRLFGFDEDTFPGSKATPLFRTGVDVRVDYTYAELRIIGPSGPEDCISMYIKRNLLLVVAIEDKDGSTVNSFYASVKKYPAPKVNKERLILCFIESLLSGKGAVSEELHNRLQQMESVIIHGKDRSKDQAKKRASFNVDLLNLKKKIRRYYNYYGQLLDFSETLAENENDVMDTENLIYLSNLSGRLSRLRSDMSSLIGIADHIQDAYTALLDQRMNTTVTFLTVLTTVFFPLTLVVGWYGMNFKYMPELSWKYGYLFVIALSVAEVVLMILIGRKRKWF